MTSFVVFFSSVRFNNVMKENTSCSEEMKWFELGRLLSE